MALSVHSWHSIRLSAHEGGPGPPRGVGARVGNPESETSATESETSEIESETTRKRIGNQETNESETSKTRVGNQASNQKPMENDSETTREPSRKPLARFGNQQVVNWKLEQNSETEGCPGAASPQFPDIPSPDSKTPQLLKCPGQPRE